MYKRENTKNLPNAASDGDRALCNYERVFYFNHWQVCRDISLYIFFGHFQILMPQLQSNEIFAT